MVHVVTGEIIKDARKIEVSKVTGDTQWRTLFIGVGPPGTGLPVERTEEILGHPQVYLVELNSCGRVLPHFHEVDQFQVFVSGDGTLGRRPLPALTVHYVDHHTAYGPIIAGSGGLSLFTVRQKTDPGSTYLHTPNYKSLMRPSKRRGLTKSNISVSTAVVLQNRKEVSTENLIEELGANDGLNISMFRLGADMRVLGPDPKLTAGQFYLIVGGSLHLEGTPYPAWSIAHVNSSDPPLKLCAGPRGLEALVLGFPREGYN